MTGRILGPGRHSLASLQRGDEIHTARCRIDGALIDGFAQLSGDFFEIHMDAAAAQRHGFAARVAHGLLVLSLVDGLKNQAPAQLAAIASLEWHWSFSTPVLEGDTISAVIAIRDLRITSDPKRGIVSLDVNVKNQREETVQSGSNQLMVYC